MSDILIKGMQMPKNGETITITICGDGIVFEEWKEPGSVFKAVPVPPHGRLIDADALDMNYIHIRDDGMKIYTQRAIDNAPTIIPASEEGET